MPDLFPERIETERLVLEPLHEVDVHRFYEICAHDDGIEEVTEYLTWTPHDHPKETAAFLATCEDDWREGETATYAIHPAEGEEGAGELAGVTNLDVDWDRGVGTFGMWLRRAFWGRGYSGERAAAMLAVAFDHLDLETVAVTHHAGNENSRRAVERYVAAHGGRHEGLLRSYEVADVEHGGAVDGHRYTITADEFEANRGEPPTY